MGQRRDDLYASHAGDPRPFHAKEATPLVRTRVGNLPAVVLGGAQRELWPEPASPVRVRASGGAAVLSGPWLLRAVVRLPRDHALAQRGPAAAANWFGEVHRRWLQAQGIGGAAVYAGRATQHWASFAARAPGEVMVGQRKMVGMTQTWGPQAVLLCSGTLLAAPPWPLLCAALRRPSGTAALLEGLTLSAADCLGRAVDAAAWADGLRYALRFALSQAGAALGWEPAQAPSLGAGMMSTLAACQGRHGPAV